MRNLLVLAILGLSAGPLLAAADPAINDGPLSCRSDEGIVHLEWNIVFIRAIAAWVIDRDGQAIAKLEPEAAGYTDLEAGAGTHVYTLSAVSLEGDIQPTGRCEVRVPDRGLRCLVEGREVKLAWGPILIDVLIEKFVILRNGDVVATAPSNTLTYTDTVPTVGKYLYEVIAVTGPDSQFTLGECEVSVLCFNLTYKTDGLKVGLHWVYDVPEPAVVGGRVFLIVRNGEFIAKVPGENAAEFSYEDEVPAAGEYTYEIWVEWELLERPTILFAACIIQVPQPPGGGPQDLRCAFTGHLPGGGMHPAFDGVILTWVNGDDYEAIQISRDGVTIATLPGGVTGEARSYLDANVSPGLHAYCVTGIIGKKLIPPACCRVEVPGGGVPSPRNLTCTLIRGPIPIPDPVVIEDNTIVGVVIGPDGQPVNDDFPVPIQYVLLRWENPVNYTKIIITRNGMVVATLPGTATAYRDQMAGGGKFVYTVAGVQGGAVSEPAVCTVEAPPGVVPPPQDFSCTVDDLVLNPDDPATGANGVPGDVIIAPINIVFLKWWNPVDYSSLVILRDGAVLATLPGDAMLHRDVNPPSGTHTYGIFGRLRDGRESRIVECEVIVGRRVPPVADLICGVQEKANPDTVDLAWRNQAEYDGILISRNNVLLARLPGGSTSYRDAGLAPGVYIYAVVATIGGRRSPAVTCQAVIEGPPARNLLYFSSGLNIAPVGADGVILPPLPGERITCLANNSEPLQGWSFGVQSDPQFIVPKKYDLDGTVTGAFNGGAGPSFISVNLGEKGLTMGVVVDNSAPFETLPPGVGQKLINIEYGAGPSGAFGAVYQVRYSDNLGDPPVQVLFVIDGFEKRPATLPGLVSIPGVKFLRGDVDGNGLLDITDAQVTLNWLFLGGVRPGCLPAADANDSREVNIADPIFELNFMFNGGQPPPPPFPGCGEAPLYLQCKDAGSCQ